MRSEELRVLRTAIIIANSKWKKANFGSCGLLQCYYNRLYRKNCCFHFAIYNQRVSVPKLLIPNS